MFLNFNITHVPNDVQELAAKAANWTKKIEADLQSGAAISIASIIPEGEIMREEIIAICEIAANTCSSIAAADFTGVQARLQRLGSDITKMQHNHETHGISYYIACFEVVFADIFGKN